MANPYLDDSRRMAANGSRLLMGIDDFNRLLADLDTRHISGAPARYPCVVLAFYRYHDQSHKRYWQLTYFYESHLKMALEAMEELSKLEFLPEPT